MIEIKKVTTHREINQFIDFPLKLYKGNSCFVPPLRSSERELFKKKNPYVSSCDTIYFLAYKDKEVVGRISGIIQKDANKKWGTKNVRFTRFDSIDDQEVADALFDAVKNWAIENGMDAIQGPLGFNDLEREGLLIEGFDQLSTFEEQYNFPYYQKLIENYGFQKDVDWIEQKLTLPANYKEERERLQKLEKAIFDKYKLHVSKENNIGEFVDKYNQQFFTLLDNTYSNLYGTCPISDDVQKELMKNFKLILTRKNIDAILNEKGEMVAFALCFPSIAKAVQKSKGRLNPSGIARILRAIKKPEVIDLGLIGVRDDYKTYGLPVTIILYLYDMMEENHYDHLETNLMLEDNKQILNLLTRFDGVIHKRRRSYSLTIKE